MASVLLCIDDEPGVVELVELIMRTENVVVKGASSGAEGLAVMKDTSPNIVLLDIMMPDMDGWEVFKHIKADPDLADIPIIILTARDSTFEEIVARERAGVDDYITKPFTPAELRQSVNKFLSQVN